MGKAISSEHNNSTNQGNDVAVENAPQVPTAVSRRLLLLEFSPWKQSASCSFQISSSGVSGI